MENNRQNDKYNLNTKYFDKFNQSKAQCLKKKYFTNEKRKYQESAKILNTTFEKRKKNLALCHSRQIENLSEKHRQENMQLIEDHKEAISRLDKKKFGDLIEISTSDSDKKEKQHLYQQQPSKGGKNWVSRMFEMVSNKNKKSIR